jgi:hypothetical protein
VRHRLQVALGFAVVAAAAMRRVPTVSDTSSAAAAAGVVAASVAGLCGRVVELLGGNTCSENVLNERDASKC